MWGKIAQLFFRRPDLLINHVEAYIHQAEKEYTAFKKGLVHAILGLVVSGFLLALSLSLLIFGAMLDLALGSIAHPVWLYGLPGGLLVLAIIALLYFWKRLHARGPLGELKRQAQADFELLRALAHRKS